MTSFAEILGSKTKPKEVVSHLAAEMGKNPKRIDECIECFEKASASQKGNCMEAIEYVTKKNPRLAQSCLDFVIAHINDTPPRVKWESARVIGNVAEAFPDKAAQAVPALLRNTTDKGTVVRWSAAFALTEIARYNQDSHTNLHRRFKTLLKAESNNGVRNVYGKYLKGIE